MRGRGGQRAAREKKDIFFPLEIGAFDRDTKHFTTRQIGGYFQLLTAAWVEGGRLRRTEAQLCTITKLTPEQWAEDRAVLAEKFRIDAEGAWVHDGMQRRMATLGIPIDSGAVDGPMIAPGTTLSQTRSAAARTRWDAKRDAKPGGGHANGDAKRDANLHEADAKGDANLHANLNLNPRSSTNQPSSLDPARESEESGSGWLENAGSLGDQPVEGSALALEVARISGNLSAGFASLLGPCIGNWRGLGLSDDAICTEVQRQTDAKRMQNGAWVPAAPGYYTPGLARLAAAGEPGAGGEAVADRWEQRVESYRRTGFWLPDWGAKPDAEPPNPAISKAVLAKFGFGEAA